MSEEILDVASVAEQFGVHPRTIWMWRKHPQRPLPAHVAPGSRRVYFIASEVAEWVRSHSDSPMVSTPRTVRRRRRASC